MPRFAANLSTMFREHAFLDRFAAAAAAGFDAVEFQFPYDHPADAIAARAAAAGLRTVLFNLPPGDFAAGERGLAALPGREADFDAALDRAIAYARTLDCPRLHAMAGVPPAGADPAACRATFVANLRRAAAALAPHGMTLLIEPINDRDMPGYFLTRSEAAAAIIAEAGAPNLRLQFDLYHCQIMEGDLATRLRRLMPLIGHVQIAGVPDRAEPDRGEVNHPFLLRLLDDLGYGGHVGCEYVPAGDTLAGLGWLGRLRSGD